MKKIIGILGVALVTATIFFSMNIANAQVTTLQVEEYPEPCKPETWFVMCYDGGACILICNGRMNIGYGFSNTQP